MGAQSPDRFTRREVDAVLARACASGRNGEMHVFTCYTDKVQFLRSSWQRCRLIRRYQVPSGRKCFDDYEQMLARAREEEWEGGAGPVDHFPGSMVEVSTEFEGIRAPISHIVICKSTDEYFFVVVFGHGTPVGPLPHGLVHGGVHYYVCDGLDGLLGLLDGLL